MGKRGRADAHKKTAHGGLSGRERAILLTEDVGLTILLAWIFYDAWWGIVTFPLVVYGNGRRFKEKRQRDREKQFMSEYKEVLRGLISYLESGLSVENAFTETEQNIRKMFGETSVLAEELHRLNSKVELKMPVEKAFYAFAESYPYEEVMGFAQIFVFAKRLGGDYMDNIRHTAEKIEEKVELRQEIKAAVAEKEMELHVMTVMPLAIIMYMRIGSGGFLMPLYHNIAGTLLMTVCIALYAAGLVIGRRIVDIRV